MVTRVRNVNPVQFGLVYGIITAVIAFAVALLMLPFSALMSAAGGTGPGRLFGAGMGVLFVVVAPIMYFIIGFIGGLVTAAVYNLVAGWTGGVEVTLQTTQSVTAGPPARGYTV